MQKRFSIFGSKFFFDKNCSQNHIYTLEFLKMWYGKTRVMSYELKALKRVTSSDPWVTSSNPWVTSSNLRVTSSNPRIIKSMKTQINSLNPILAGVGWGWTVESTPLNIREYFKNSLQHGFEIFWLLTFIIWGHSFEISDPYLYFCGTRAILSRLVGEILARCENTFFTISIFDVLPNKIHYGCSFALTAGFVIICHAIFRNNEININFDGEILTFFVTLTSPEGLKYNKVLTKSINLTVPINDYIINIIVLIKILLRFECRKRRLNSNKESH